MILIKEMKGLPKNLDIAVDYCIKGLLSMLGNTQYYVKDGREVIELDTTYYSNPSISNAQKILGLRNKELIIKIFFFKIDEDLIRNNAKVITSDSNMRIIVEYYVNTHDLSNITNKNLKHIIKSPEFKKMIAHEFHHAKISLFHLLFFST
jgi:hypothetical protein